MIQLKKEDTIIVTRHKGLVEWLNRYGITGEVKASVTPDDIRGKHVIGALPAHIAKDAFCVTSVDYICPFEKRGQELTADELEALGAKLFTYVVVPIVDSDPTDMMDETELTEEPKIIRCADCKWWRQDDDIAPYGYCYACKSGTYTEHWEISIRRKYKGDFFCADGELRTEEEE